ncbi:EAL domain-containing protein [Henriciella sp.]|uniref:putative bifunctional diguanylate cyclase/phosphodiesterase n=1 Tax=Henriciella sp. TaxID=1968823 RepID=UPI0017BF35F2|nr:EAL domain-containing protein [Henriciella sp.]HIG23710.1 EAL domain-containing protein [Henriciella sp.]
MAFRHLKTKLVVAYGGLLGLILAVNVLTSYFAIEAAAREKIDDEMAATEAVSNRLWQMRADKLEEAAGVVSRDFGFREAVATDDVATMSSALENFLNRLDAEAAYIVTSDGRGLMAGATQTETVEAELLAALNANGQETGVAALDAAVHQIVSRPIMAPTLLGWVLFAERLDEAELSELETLSAIPLTAQILIDGQNGDDAGSKPGFVTRSSPIKGFGHLPDAVLKLEYPLAGAMAPFRSMLLIIALMAAGGIVALLVCTWFISRTVTGPIMKLDEAAQAIADGKKAGLDVKADDEIGRLANSFSHMVKEVQAREDNILKLSLTDPETELPNRRAMEMFLSGTDRADVYCAAVSPERFANITSVIGQAASNELVALLGQRLQDMPDILALGRLGGEVIGIAIGAASDEEAHALLGAILEGAGRPVRVRGELVDVQLSAGFAPLGSDGKLSPLDQSVIGLHQARQRRLPIFAFDKVAYGDPSGTLSLMSEMVAGMEDGSLYLTYQPKVDLRSQTVCSAEALLRWEHPERGFVSPEDFVRAAEETGHIRPLSEWVFRQVKDERARFLDAGHDIKIAVNLSGRLLTDTDFLRWSIGFLGAEADRYCLEVTETAVIDDPTLALANIQLLREAGFEISIDDYGSGLSSLSYLKQIPAHELKIDKSFVLPLKVGSSDALLIKSTIDLAHSLGMKVTAEGVETREIMSMLSVMGADRAQGYYISRPVRSESLIAFLNSFTVEADDEKSLKSG